MMKREVKIALVARDEGAQFVRCHCGKVFISDTHLKRHEKRRHISKNETVKAEVNPVDRIQRLLSLFDLPKTNEKLEVNITANNSEPIVHKLKFADEININHVKPLVHMNSNVDVWKNPVEKGCSRLLGAGNAELGGPHCRADIDFGIDENDIDSDVWKFCQLARQASFIDDYRPSYSIQVPYQMNEPAIRVLTTPYENIKEGKSVEMQNQSNENCLDDSSSRESSSSDAGRQFKASKIMTVDDCKREIVARLETHVEELGINPKAKGVTQQQLENARLVLHSKRSTLLRENSNAEGILTDVKIKIEELLQQKLLERKVTDQSS